MWTTSELTVANNANGRINAFVRGLYKTADGETLVLINQNPGPGVSPQNSGEVWMMVDANTPGLVPIGNATAPTPTPPGGAPTAAITSPQNGSTVPAGNVTVTAQVENLNVVDKQGQANVAGEGHVHFYMDLDQIPSNASAPAIPTNTSIQWAHVSATTYTFTNVTPGQHTFTVQLANNDHTPVYPIVTDTVTVTVTGTGGGPTVTPTPTTAPTLNSTFDLQAHDLAFNHDTITVQAGAQVTVNFNNMDAGILHNFALYTDSSATTMLFRGAYVTGPATTTYTFAAPSTPGTYFFRCDVHPTQMTGQFIVT